MKNDLPEETGSNVRHIQFAEPGVGGVAGGSFLTVSQLVFCSREQDGVFAFASMPWCNSQSCYWIFSPDNFSQPFISSVSSSYIVVVIIISSP